MKKLLLFLFFFISSPLVSAVQWQSLGQHSGSEYFFDKNSISGSRVERLITIKRNYIEGNFAPMSQEYNYKINCNSEEFSLISINSFKEPNLSGDIVPSNTQNLNIARKSDPQKYTHYSYETMGQHVRIMIAFKKKGAHVFDYGNNLRAGAEKIGVKDAFAFPGFVPAYIRPLFCEGSGPFRWIALSGDPEDIRVTDEALKKLFPENKSMINWLDKAQKMIQFQGLPARICWLKYGDREKAALLFNQLVREKKVKAPIVIGRDHLDCGSVASPNRETESMMDGSDAVSDWPLLNAMININN